jgi:hypothetical protein
MLQFYFLSVAANFLAGATLGAEWMAAKFTSLAAILQALSARRARLVTGLAALLSGVGTFFFPADARLFGDLFPSVVGIAVGISLLFEVLRQEVLFPGERPVGGDKVVKGPLAYRTALGALGIAAAVLHFFLPERLFL